jgi:hypothetical protein
MATKTSVDTLGEADHRGKKVFGIRLIRLLSVDECLGSFIFLCVGSYILFAGGIGSDPLRIAARAKLM